MPRARSGSCPDAHCPDCPFADRGDWVIYRAEYEALLRDRERAIVTRENANAVSVRVEAENRGLREALEQARDLVAEAYSDDEDNDSPGNMAFAVLNHALEKVSR